MLKATHLGMHGVPPMLPALFRPCKCPSLPYRPCCGWMVPTATGTASGQAHEDGHCATARTTGSPVVGVMRGSQGEGGLGWEESVLDLKAVEGTAKEKGPACLCENETFLNIQKECHVLWLWLASQV